MSVYFQKCLSQQSGKKIWNCIFYCNRNLFTLWKYIYYRFYNMYLYISKPKQCISLSPRLIKWALNAPLFHTYSCCVLHVLFRWGPEAARYWTACWSISASVSSKSSVWQFSEVSQCLRGSSRENVLNSFVVRWDLGRLPLMNDLAGCHGSWENTMWTEQNAHHCDPSDNEYLFLDLEQKLSKYFGKRWNRRSLKVICFFLSCFHCEILFP